MAKKKKNNKGSSKTPRTCSTQPASNLSAHTAPPQPSSVSHSAHPSSHSAPPPSPPSPSPLPSRAAVKSEPEIIDVDQLHHVERDDVLPLSHRLRQLSSASRAEAQHAPKSARKRTSSRDRQRSAPPPPKKRRARHSQPHEHEHEHDDGDTPSVQAACAPEHAPEPQPPPPPPQPQPRAAAEPSPQALPPDEGGVLCETVIHKQDATHVTVTTTQRHQTAVKCPCEQRCGRLVRVGPYAKFAQLGTPLCAHCRARVGSEHGFNSYPQLVAHVFTKTCRAVQMAQRKRRKPKQILGKKTVHKIDGERYRVVNDGGEWFRCFRCGVAVEYAGRYSHCVQCFTR